MQKIAIISDIHGNIAALEKVVEDIQLRNVDCIFNLGDHLSGPLWPKETIEFLMRQDWMQIRGNHERQLISQNADAHGLSDRYAFQQLNKSELDWLNSLPVTQSIQTPYRCAMQSTPAVRSTPVAGGVPDEFLLVHGTPNSDTDYFLETVAQGFTRLATPAEIKSRQGDIKSRVIFCGHTHLPRVVETDDAILIVNPGSVGLPAYEDNFPEYHVVETGSHRARYAILEYRNGNWIAELIAIVYDYQKAAQQARKNGRPEWEKALLTGFMH